VTQSDRVIAIIPARGGSKGLPGKNVRMIGGKPLIAHSVEHALQAGVCDRVLVTTDDAAIKAAAVAAGAWVPFMRDGSLAEDLRPLTALLTSLFSCNQRISSGARNGSKMRLPGCDPSLS
jgi:CMP-N-acetylneuraminic acid synthetase